MKVTKIDATKPVAPAAAPNLRKKRVAAYCRVSTDSEEQESSYAVQCAHYAQLIGSNPEWEEAGLFADEGISGTQAKSRPAFLRMIEACEQGRIAAVGGTGRAAGLQDPAGTERVARTSKAADKEISEERGRCARLA